MDPSRFPVTIRREERAFKVHWRDGHVSVLPFVLLRERCPCATCGETPPRVVREDDPLKLFDDRPIYADNASLVGRYGLQIHWNDGHSTGIYAFRYLRQLCPCQECHPEAPS